MFIQDEKEYDEVRTYVIHSIRTLMNDGNVKRKDSLKLILKDVERFGFIPSGNWKQGFFLRLFMYDRRRQGSGIDQLVIDLERFKGERISNYKPHTLEKFFG
jgi:hypothetical protein